MSTLKDFEGVDWSEPPRGLIRGVMKRHGLTEREARRRCGLDLAEEEMVPVRDVQVGEVFWYNSLAWRRLDGRKHAGVQGHPIPACTVASKIGPEPNDCCYFRGSLEVNLCIPEEARKHLPEKEISD